ncbi:unnamed protein product, partial [Prorocentrum cordatum]
EEAPRTTVREGLAEVLAPGGRAAEEAPADVFYNPAQVFNRDLSVLVLAAFARRRAAGPSERRAGSAAPPRGLLVLDALSATGIRSIRYAREFGDGADGVHRIVANDLDTAAAAAIARNVAHNGIPAGRVEVSCEDAALHMYARRACGPRGAGASAYDVIDLDPYGTAVPFLDSAVQAVADGGLLCITSTDMRVLGGNTPETCFVRYGGTALKRGYLHEMALRLLLHAVVAAAARYGREARPLVCCSLDFYVRIFVQVSSAAARAKHTAARTGTVSQCVQCDSFFVQPLGEAAEGPKDGQTKFRPAHLVSPGPECPECGGRFEIGGPFHIGRLHDEEFVQSCLELCEHPEQFPGVTSWKKVAGLLTAISEEHADIPLYYRVPQLCKSLKLNPIPMRLIRGTLGALGYRVSHFHREPEAIKTDAPNHVVYDLMRLWAREHPPKALPLPRVIEKAVQLGAAFEWTEEAKPTGKVRPKFLPNPAPHWGPMSRARGAGHAREAVG